MNYESPKEPINLVEETYHFTESIFDPNFNIKS
jgi:hypothetical protein